MHDYTTCRCTSLPGCTDSTEDDRRNSKVEVGMFIHDDRIIAAQFEQALAQAIGEPFTNTAADPCRARERNQVDSFVFDMNPAHR